MTEYRVIFKREADAINCAESGALSEGENSPESGPETAPSTGLNCTEYGARKFSEDQVYRLIEKKRLPAGKFGTQLIASPAAIRERLATLANGGDADGAHGDGRAGEMTDRE